MGVSAILLFGACGQGDEEARGPEAQSHSNTTVIQEDNPRWNCETMGNRRCGPSTTIALPRSQAARCSEAKMAVENAGLTLPVGWSFVCFDPGELTWQGFPTTGLTEADQKRVTVDPSQNETDAELRGTLAHEYCHANDYARGRDSSNYVQNERQADTCAARYRFPVGDHGLRS